MRYKYSIKTTFLMVISLVFVVMDVLTANSLITWGGAFFGFCFLVLLLEPFIRINKHERPEAKNEFIAFDESSIKRVIPNQLEESINWNELDEIAIATNDQGPFVDDVHWLLMNKDKSRGVAISNDAIGFGELLSKLQTLPAFDNEQVIKAMGCTENNFFLVWKKH